MRHVLTVLGCTSLLSLGTLACNSSSFSSSGEQTRREAPQLPAQVQMISEDFSLNANITQSGIVDVVFVVDTSGSMYEEKELLEQNMQSFLTQFQTSANQLDYRVFLIGKDFSFPTQLDASRFFLIDRQVESQDGLFVLYDFLTRGSESGQRIRPNATVEAIVISDDNAIESIDGISAPGWQFMNADEFVAALSQNKPFKELHVNGLVGKTEGRVNDWCTIEETGSEYEKLAAMPEYRGLMEDLCTTDWNPLLAKLADNIIERVDPQSFSLKSRPDLSRTMSIQVDGQTISNSDIRIEEDGTIVILDEQLKRRQGGKMTISYYPAG